MAAQEPGVFTDDVPNRTTALVIISIVFLILTTAFFAFRQGWRWAHRQRGMDDIMAACAYVLLVIMTVFGGISAHYGFGKHRKDIVATFPKAMEWFYLYQICYKLIGGFTKLTFCFLYLRIFNQKTFQRITYGVMVIVAAGSLAFAIGTVFQCSPVHRAWDRRVKGYCISNEAFWYSHAAFNTFWDIVIFIMPIPLINSLKLRSGQKTGLLSIFALGIFVIAASIVRMVELRHSAHTDDPTWGSTIALIWTEVEANTSVIVCCLPALRVPFLNLWHSVRGGTWSAPPTTDEPPSRGYDSTWSGPFQSQPAVSHPSSHGQGSRTSNRVMRTNISGSNGKSSHSHSTNSKLASGETWYDKVLSSLSQGNEEASRGSSMAELAHSESAVPSRLELGAIYKTTDVHVSTQDVHQGLEPDAQRQVSLQEMLSSSK